jgi:hypothetical protein
MTDAPANARVTIVVRNNSAEPVDLVLEPWGRIYTLQPGEPRTISYEGDPNPTLSLDVAAHEVKIWAEGHGELSLSEPAT